MTKVTFQRKHKRVRCLYPNACKYHTHARTSGIILCSPTNRQKSSYFPPQKDLTQQGIEPNPGPPKKAIVKRKKKVPNKDRILRVRTNQPAGRKVTGHGGYVSDIASKAGSWLGNKAGGWLESLLGLGEYSVRKNTLMRPKSGSPNDPPTFTNSAGGTIVTHREFIQDIVATVDFNNQVFPINPGLSLTHPWVSNVATSFAQYRPLGIIFEYKSTATTALSTATNQEAGVVIMATNYNVLDPVFSDKRTMENYTYVTSCSPYENAMHPVECDPVTLPVKELYVRSATVGDADLRFNDLGNFQIATTGMPAAGGKIGELWATYQYELIKPRLPTGSTSVLPDHWSYVAALNPSLVRPTEAALFGEVGLPGSKVVHRGVGASTITFSSASPNTILFTSSGRYLVTITATGSGTPSTIDWDPSTRGTGVTGVEMIAFGAVYQGEAFFPNGTSSSMVVGLVAVDVDLSLGAGPQGVTLNPVAINGTITSLDLFINPLPSSFTARNPKIPMSIDDKINELRALIKSKSLFVEVDEKQC